MHGTSEDWFFGHGFGMTLVWVIVALLIAALVKYIFFR